MRKRKKMPVARCRMPDASCQSPVASCQMPVAERDSSPNQLIQKKKPPGGDFFILVQRKGLAVKLIWINMFEIIIYHWKSPPFKRIILLFHKQIKAKPCISSIPQELHLINTQCCISSSRRGNYTRLCRDDIPSQGDG